MSKELRLRHFRGTHVADSAVDVAFFLEAKESGAAGRVAENEALLRNGLLADNHVFNNSSADLTDRCFFSHSQIMSYRKEASL